MSVSSPNQLAWHDRMALGLQMALKSIPEGHPDREVLEGHLKRVRQELEAEKSEALEKLESEGV